MRVPHPLRLRLPGGWRPALVVAGLGLLTATGLWAASGLSSVEEADLLYMREEEKLAHDVYALMAQRYDLPIFQHISGVESGHEGAMAGLLTTYKLTDPVAGLSAGRFANATMQQMYDELAGSGQASLGRALEAGATIEEVNIRDLRVRAARTTHDDVRQAYQALERMSYHHLQAFTGVLKRQTGQTWTPRYLDQELYADILSGRLGGLCGMAGGGNGCARGDKAMADGCGKGGNGAGMGAGCGMGAGQGAGCGMGAGKKSGDGCAMGAGKKPAAGCAAPQSSSCPEHSKSNK